MRTSFYIPRGSIIDMPSSYAFNNVLSAPPMPPSPIRIELMRGYYYTAPTEQCIIAHVDCNQDEIEAVYREWARNEIVVKARLYCPDYISDYEIRVVFADERVDYTWFTDSV